MSHTESDQVVYRVLVVRKNLGMTREALAERLASHGSRINRNVLANIESGRRDASGRRRREVTVDELVDLSRALQVSVAALLGAVPLCSVCADQPPSGFACLGCGAHGPDAG